MKLYQIILKVSDDFVPDEMEISLPVGKSVEVCTEGFIGPNKFVECDPEVEIPQDSADLFTGMMGGLMSGLMGGAAPSDIEVPSEDVKPVEEEVEGETEEEAADEAL